MADEPNWQPIEAPPWAKKEAAPAEPSWQPIEAPPWAKQTKGEAPTLGRVAQRAGEAMGETASSAWEAAKRLVVPPSREEAQKYLGPSGALRSLTETGAGILSPLTGTFGTLTSGVASPIASGVSEAARQVVGGDPRRSEEMYQRALPMAEAAVGAVGRVPSVAGAGRAPIPAPVQPKITRTPAQGPEAEAGRYLESKATDPAAFRQRLQQPGEEIAGRGDQPTLFEHTGDLGIAQQERAAARRPGQVEEHQQRKIEQTQARLRALENLQPTGDPAAVAANLRATMNTETAAADAAVVQAQQRVMQTAQQLGGTYDPTTYGNIMRRSLEDAHEVNRAYERALWDRIDPNLRANPQGVQELERRIYGVMPEGGAAEASLSAAERQIGGVIQNFPPQGIPFSELRTLRSMVSAELRKELVTNGSTPAYARLAQLRGGIEDAIAGSVPPDVYEQVRAATAATAQRAQTFRAEGVKQATRREGVQGPYRVGEASVPEQFIKTGPGGYDRASNYLRAVGEPGLADFADAVAAKARRTVIGSSGEINPGKLQTFLRQHQETLRAIDERDGGAFSQRLRNLSTAQETMEAAEAQRVAVTKKYKDDAFKELIGVDNDADATRMIGNIFGKHDSVTQAQNLMRRLTTPQAREGARAAVARYIREQLLTMASVNDDPVFRSQQFQKWVALNKNALSQIMDPAQVQGLEDISRSLQRAARLNQTKAVGGGSDSVQAFLAEGNAQGAFRQIASKHGPVVARTLVHMIAYQMGVPELAATLGADILITGQLAKRAARKAAAEAQRMKTIQEMVDDAILNPEKARELLGKTHVTKTRMPGVGRGAAYRAGAISAGEEQPASRQTGGGVPAIGGTGGRSPGARAAARARQARQGASQALQDGGTARDSQASEIRQPGLRERYAALLTATPASGPGFERLATRKGLTALRREDIVKQLKERGISTEGWEQFAGGEAPSVDSRDVDRQAIGGAIDDEEPEERVQQRHERLQRRDPSDLTPAETVRERFGEWDVTPKGYAPTPPEESDIGARVMTPGERFVDPFGHRGTRHEGTGFYMLRGMQEGGEVEKPPLPDAIMDAWEGQAARVRRRAPTREPDPASLAASQGNGATWGALGQGALEGLKTPGRAYREGLTPEEEVEFAGGLALGMAGSRLPFHGQGDLGIFAGKGSRTANLDMLAKAERMQAAGASPDAIWNQTGWARDASGEWLYQISDVGSYIKPTERIHSATSEAASRPSGYRAGTLEEIIHHPEFFEAYPEFKTMPASLELGARPGGGYRPPSPLDPTSYRIGGLNPKDVGAIEVRAPSAHDVVAGDYAVSPKEITARDIILHEMQHGVQQAEGFAPGGNPMRLPFTDRQITNMAKKETESRGIPWYAVRPDDRKKIEQAVRFKIYEEYAGETQARNVSRRRDIPGAGPAPWKTEDVPRERQRIPADEAIALGFKPRKGQKPFKKAVPYAEGGDVDDDKLPLPGQSRGLRSTAGPTVTSTMREEEIPAPITNRAGETLPTYILKEWGKGMIGLPERATKAAGELQREGDVYDPGPALETALMTMGATPFSAPAGALGAGPVVRRLPQEGGRHPGIYKDPRVVAAEAAEKVAPEHPAMKELFGVTRQDLYDISQQGRRPGNLPDPSWVARPEKGRGSFAAEAVMTPANEQRILDAMREAERYPQLIRGMDAWYVMDPAYQRLEALHGPELAKRLYNRLNTTGAMTSPASDVMNEIRRGTAANMMAHQGRFPTWRDFAGVAEKDRPAMGRAFPPELRDVPGHLAHRTAHAIPIENYLQRGAIEMGSAKVPMYIPASGVPQTGFQTRWMVPDAHISKSLGMADVRTPGTVRQGASMSMPEYRQIGPWYRERIAQPLGIEAVPAQARQWGLFAPQTGVRTLVGAPKLELLSQRIWERAMERGWDPKVLRDYVLSGGAHAALAAGVITPAMLSELGGQPND